MEENNLISAPQALGLTDLATFVLLTEPTVEREEFMCTNDLVIRPGRGGYCPTVYL